MIFNQIMAYVAACWVMFSLIGINEFSYIWAFLFWPGIPFTTFFLYYMARNIIEMRRENV
jgi:hypothetical protein